MSRLLCIYCLFIVYQLSAQQNVGIGTTTPDPTAVLEIASSGKGLLAPRMTTAERDAILSPANGLLIYNTTDNTFNYFDGSVWIKDEDRDATNELQTWSTLPGIPAGFADGVDNVNDADSDPNNEKDNLGNHSATTHLLLNNRGILNPDLLAFNDAGFEEGISWAGTQAYIYVSQIPGSYVDTDGWLRLINDDGISLESHLRVTGSTNFYAGLNLNNNNLLGVNQLVTTTLSTNGVNLNDNNIQNINALSFNDPGDSEGVLWTGTGAKIFVSPLNGGNSDGALRLINDDFIVFETGGEDEEAMYLWPDKHAQFQGWIDMQGGTAGLSPADAGTQMHRQLRIVHPNDNTYSWWIGHQGAAPTATDDDLYFYVVRGGSSADNVAGYVQDNEAGTQMNFTGQHRSLVTNIDFTDPAFDASALVGLIVVADQNSYLSMSGGLRTGTDAIMIDEALPVVSISTRAKDKRVFGVISSMESDERHDDFGAFATPYYKEEGDERMYINATGEGAIWVVDQGGNLMSGDYIQTSDIPGYGMLQDDDILHNYTVAKITMDCDFQPRLVPKRQIRKTQRNEGAETVEANALDAYGRIIWDEVTDDHGAVIMEPTYQIRYLTHDGVQISKKEYEALRENCVDVYRAAFVGCTYHCG